MDERIFNCYAIVENDIIREVALAVHSHSGSDEEKELFLREHAGNDFTGAELFPVPENFIITDLTGGDMITGIPWVIFRRMLGTAEDIMVFEKGFQALEAPLSPMINISVVIHGAVIGADQAKNR